MERIVKALLPPLSRYFLLWNSLPLWLVAERVSAGQAWGEVCVVSHVKL